MKKILFGTVMLVFCILFVFNFNNDNSFTKKNVSYNGENLKINIDGVEVEKLPDSGNYYLANYDCKGADTKLVWDNDSYELNVSNGSNDNALACYLDFQTQPLLSSMSEGSYVKYVGNNGCSGELCNGKNANYINENNMGYCESSDYKFITDGFRIGYIDKKNVYLISAGAPECMCTTKDGKKANSGCSSYLTSANLYKSIDNMNEVALKYCNSKYTSGGICDNTTVWAMNDNDYKKILGTKLDINSCNGKNSNKTCGYGNDLIDIGGHYRFASMYDKSSENLLYWRGDYRGVFNRNSSYSYGVRPVIKLDSSIVVVGGNGTYEDPYLIDNNTFSINNGDVHVTDKSNVNLSLIASSEVSSMCISVETSGCSNYVEFNKNYTLNLSREEDGEKTIYVYYKNKNGNVIASLSKDIVLDGVGPSDNKVKISEGNSLNRKLYLQSTGADYMCISNTSNDVSKCSEWLKYSSSYNWRLSDGDGEKTVYVFFKDSAGNISNAVSDTINFTRKCLDKDGVYTLGYTGNVINSNGIDVKLCGGTYKLETWGAQGGNFGGKGGYSKGNITLKGTETLFFYVGGAGGKGTDAGFNGGGTTGSTGGAGGGATDIRVGIDSLYARVIVAGGGGGNGKDICAIGGSGGGVSGVGGNLQESCGTGAFGGTQNSGGKAGVYNDINGTGIGTFGIGGNAVDGIYDGGAGGGGWYGGGAGVSLEWSNGGGGGSGFVYTEDAEIPRGYKINKEYYLSDVVMLDGDSTDIPTINNEISNNGFIKITKLS